MNKLLILSLGLVLVGFSQTTLSPQDSLSYLAGSARGDYGYLNYALGTSSVSSGGFQTAVTSVSNPSKRVEILDTSGSAIYFATGAAGSEVIKFIIFPGGINNYYVDVPAGTRISLKAQSTGEVITSGKIYMNFFGQ